MRMRGRMADFVYCEAEPEQHETLKDPNNPKEKLWYYPVITFESEQLESCESAIEHNVRVMPSEELYDGYLEIYGNKLQRFKYSATQRKTLLLLKHAGARGLAQNELSNVLGKGGNNFGYVMTALEERGKIFKKKANVKSSNGKLVTTSMVWLSCFKSSVEATIAASNEMRISTGNGETIIAEFSQDEDSILRILEYLDTASPPGTAVEGTIKHDLGYQNKAGHKLWRRIREKMVDMGLISCFQGVLEQSGREESFIKKLKHFEIDIAPESCPTIVHSPPRWSSNQLVELSLDRQILLEIVKRGREGATSSDLGARLGLSLKKHNVRFSELIDYRFNSAGEFGIKSVKVTVDKSTQNSYRVSEQTKEMILNANKAFFPDGYATQTAIEYDTPIDAPEPHMEGPPVYYTEDNRAYPEIFSWRLSWLVEEVKQKGFILGLQASSYLIEKEKILRARIGGEVPKEIDHKTVGRLADKASKEKMLKVVEIQVPSRSGISGPQNVTVYLEHDLELSDDMYHRILKSYEEIFQNRAQKKPENVTKPVVPGDFRMLKSNKGKAFDIYNIQIDNGYLSSKLLRCQVIAEAVLRMIESRADDYVTESFKSLLNAANLSDSSDIRCIQEVPERRILDMGVVYSKTQDISVFEPTRAHKRLVFTRDELWNSLTVQDFVSGLGSTCEDKSYLLSNASRSLSDFSRGELTKLAGNTTRGLAGPQKHFHDILRELVKLGVLKSIGVTGKILPSQDLTKDFAGEDGVYYMLSDQVSCEHQVPSGGSSMEYLPADGAQSRSVANFSFFDAEERRGYWIQLQCLFSSIPKSQYISNAPNIGRSSLQQKACFPADRVLNMNIGRHGSSTEDLEKVKVSLANENIDVNEISADWRQIDALSTKWNIPVETVIRGLSEAHFLSKRISNRLIGFPGNKKESKSKRSRKRSRSVARNTEVAPIEDDDDELILLQPEAIAPPPRKRKWSEGEDRELLLAWVRSLVYNGKDKKIQWKKMPFPSGMNETRWRNRISRLLSSEVVEDYMNAIKGEAEKVHQRNKMVQNPGKKQSYTGPNLFEVQSDEDLQSMQKILADIEKVVAGAPERPSDGNDLTSARFERLAKSQPDGSSPNVLLAWLHTFLMKAKQMSGNFSIPSIEVTGAMSTVLSLLYQVECMGKSPEFVRKILSERFSEESLRHAVKLLLQNGLITSDNTGKMKFHLSSRFKAEIKPPFAPLMLAEDTEFLNGISDGEIWPLPGRAKPISLIPGLSVAIMGNAKFSTTVPNDIQDAFEASKDNENASGRLGKHCLQRNMASICLTETPDAPHMSSEHDRPETSVLYQPKDVLDRSEEYKKAKNAFLEESTHVFGANVGNSILETISKAGPTGVAMSSLRSLLHHNNLSVDTARIDQLLQKFGLVRIIQGYDEKYIVSSLTSSHLVILKKEAQDSTSCQPCREVPIRPWIDPENGTLLTSFWNSLVHRIIDIVSRFPGINGDVLIQSLRVLPPLYAKEIIESLCTEHILYYRIVRNSDTTLENGIFSEEYAYSRKQQVNTTSLIWGTQAKEPPFISGEAREYTFFVNPNKIHHALHVKPLYIYE